jgi:hypothetical protein
MTKQIMKTISLNIIFYDQQETIPTAGNYHRFSIFLSNLNMKMDFQSELLYHTDVAFQSRLGGIMTSRVCKHVHTYVCTYVHTFVHMCVHAFIRMHTFVHMCVHAFIHMHACTYLHTQHNRE